MTVTKTLGPDSRWNFHSDSTEHTMMLTGPIYGTVTTGDGTAYRVNEDWIEVLHHHVGELSHLIGLHHESNGHPHHDDENPFVHLCDAHCGDLARPVEDAIKSYTARVKAAAGPERLKSQEHADRVAAIQRDHAHINAPVEA